jgi:hypothetical protein
MGTKAEGGALASPDENVFSHTHKHSGATSSSVFVTLPSLPARIGPFGSINPVHARPAGDEC